MTNTLGAPNMPASYQPIPYRVDADEDVTCPHCQLQNDSDASYCDQCGTELAGATVTVGGASVSDYAPEPYEAEDDENVQCPVCQHMNDPDARFCDQCGTSLVGRPDVKVVGDVSDPDEADDEASEMSRSKAPREGVIRRVEFRAVASDGQTLEGYAAVFNDPALIDSWEGTFRERVLPGAFKKTIAERTPVLMFDHGKHPMVGSIPIGTIRVLREDSHGLYVKAKLADNWLVQPVRDAIAEQAVNGMSIRMNVIKDQWGIDTDKVVTRDIREVALPELGPVVFPAYENTKVSVRSREVATALADPEVRAEFARILASGTDLSSAADRNEPGARHSVHASQRRKALALLNLS